MINKFLAAFLSVAFLFCIDIYVYQALKVVFADSTLMLKKIIFGSYWCISIILMLGMTAFHLLSPEVLDFVTKRWIMTGIFVFSIAKIFGIIPLILDDLVRFGKWVAMKFSSPKAVEDVEKIVETSAETISRSEFLAHTSLAMVGIPLVLMTNGIFSGAYDYRIRKQKIVLPNLPKAFDGFRLVQISDVHSGSFFDKKAVMRGIEMINAEKPDVVCFTGDLVNNTSDEMREYAEIFSKIKAGMGVYSVTGNHDYGDYVRWDTESAKKKNFEDLKAAHKFMGWNLLLNEHAYLETNGEKIALLGVENWGEKRFAKYGDLQKTHQNAEADVKILLSHDPSHWDAQVVPQYKDIDISLAGHTHGFQFGIEIGNFKWSPVQYVYEQWAGLYTKGNQHLYVNRGFGFLGFPGRIGILPEITVLELVRKA